VCDDTMLQCSSRFSVQLVWLLQKLPYTNHTGLSYITAPSAILISLRQHKMALATPSTLANVTRSSFFGPGPAVRRLACCMDKTRTGRFAEQQLPPRTFQDIVADANKVYAAKKVPWCQPWTIVLSGSLAIAVSWGLFGHGWWSVVSVGVTAGVALWWYLFLVELPVLLIQDPSILNGQGVDVQSPIDDRSFANKKDE
jgi:hypothetical protein